MSRFKKMMSSKSSRFKNLIPSWVKGVNPTPHLSDQDDFYNTAEEIRERTLPSEGDTRSIRSSVRSKSSSSGSSATDKDLQRRYRALLGETDKRQRSSSLGDGKGYPIDSFDNHYSQKMLAYLSVPADVKYNIFKFLEDTPYEDAEINDIDFACTMYGHFTKVAKDILRKQKCSIEEIDQRLHGFTLNLLTSPELFDVVLSFTKLGICYFLTLEMACINWNQPQRIKREQMPDIDQKLEELYENYRYHDRHAYNWLQKHCHDIFEKAWDQLEAARHRWVGTRKRRAWHLETALDQPHLGYRPRTSWKNARVAGERRVTGEEAEQILLEMYGRQNIQDAEERNEHEALQLTKDYFVFLFQKMEICARDKYAKKYPGIEPTPDQLHDYTIHIMKDIDTHEEIFAGTLVQIFFWCMVVVDRWARGKRDLHKLIDSENYRKLSRIYDYWLMEKHFHNFMNLAHVLKEGSLGDIPHFSARKIGGITPPPMERGYDRDSPTNITPPKRGDPGVIWLMTEEEEERHNLYQSLREMGRSHQEATAEVERLKPMGAAKKSANPEVDEMVQMMRSIGMPEEEIQAQVQMAQQGQFKPPADVEMEEAIRAMREIGMPEEEINAQINIMNQMEGDKRKKSQKGSGFRKFKDFFKRDSKSKKKDDVGGILGKFVDQGLASDKDRAVWGIGSEDGGGWGGESEDAGASGYSHQSDTSRHNYRSHGHGGGHRHHGYGRSYETL